MLRFVSAASPMAIKAVIVGSWLLRQNQELFDNLRRGTYREHYGLTGQPFRAAVGDGTRR